MKQNGTIKDEENAIIIAARLQGMTTREIAAQTALSPSTVHRRLQDDEIRAIIDRERRDLVNHASEAKDVLLDTMRQTEDRKLRYDASKTVLQSTGILPSHTPPALVTQVYSQTNIIGDSAIESLRGFMTWRSTQDAVDIEAEPSELPTLDGMTDEDG